MNEQGALVNGHAEVLEEKALPESLPEKGHVNYSFVPGANSACRYYRVETPFRAMGELNLADSIIDDKGTGRESLGLMLEADTVLWYALGGQGPISTVNFMRGKAARKIQRVKPSYAPPAMIYDIDDNIEWVHPMNPAYCFMGTRDLEGSRLEPGAVLKTKLPDGSDYTLWEDKKTVVEDKRFDVIANQEFVDKNIEFMKIVDAVTVCSPYLKKYMEEKHGVKNIHVYHNSVVPEDYPQVTLAPHDGVRILWQGGDSHLVDLYPLKDAFKAVAEKYPQAKFVFWGSRFEWIFNHIPKEQWEHRKWVNYDAYKAYRVLADADINLCPLVDNEFGRSKSAIKWYEASILNRPEATLAANCLPYAGEMVDGENGLLYNTPEEFAEKLGQLIENAELRKQLGENAKKWVLDNRHYLKTGADHFAIYQEARARVRFGLESG